MKNKRLAIILALLLIVIAPLLAGCNETISNHVIEVYSSSIQQGKVWGDGLYKTGESVTLTAQEQNGSVFVAWIKNNMEVSTKKEFTFTANSLSEGKYTAVFHATPVFYYQASGVAIEYKHLINNSFGANVRITGITLKLTLLNSNNVQTIFDKSDLNIEVTDSFQNSETLKIESNYYLSKLKTYYLDVQIRYVADTQNAVLNKTIVVDFSNISYLQDELDNTHAQTTINAKNTSMQTMLVIAFHPAGCTLPNSLILWN